MSELKSIVIIVCMIAGFVLALGGVVAYSYGESVYVSTYKREIVYPYRGSGISLITCGIALIIAGCAVICIETEVTSERGSADSSKEGKGDERTVWKHKR